MPTYKVPDETDIFPPPILESNMDAAERIYQDPKCLYISASSFERRIQNLFENASARREVEAALYAPYDRILTDLCSSAEPDNAKATVSCHPQSVLIDDVDKLKYPIRFLARRIPDWAVLVTYLQLRAPDTGIPYRVNHPLFKLSQLLFWMEAKPLAIREAWSSLDAQEAAGAAVSRYVSQLMEQAEFGFRHHSGDAVYAILVVATYFSVFRFDRPQPSPDTPVKSSPAAPSTPPPPALRKRRRLNRSGTAQLGGGAGPSVVPLAALRAPPSKVKEAADGEQGEISPHNKYPPVKAPSVLYYNEPVLVTVPSNDNATTDTDEKLSPIFLQALQDVMGVPDGNCSFQPSYMQPPANVVRPSAKSLDVSKKLIDTALKLRDQQDLTHPHTRTRTQEVP
ncbi:hypothetical protein FA95DRAFT_405850 [Auriscalpium vulgare]|uniref:Uncharacterized protein n=1 Tax=Auriscalpium vulgare TaxID=40419 RepID=A0ACB8RHJ5_9AGAM|nr:hypothetical protein FA95DRAFT_405850 [Auriscalpium vulgare]